MLPELPYHLNIAHLADPRAGFPPSINSGRQLCPVTKAPTGFELCWHWPNNLARHCWFPEDRFLHHLLLQLQEELQEAAAPGLLCSSWVGSHQIPTGFWKIALSPREEKRNRNKNKYSLKTLWDAVLPTIPPSFCEPPKQNRTCYWDTSLISSTW